MTSTALRTHLVQLNATVGDLPGNSALIRAAWQTAKDSGVDLVVVPECALTGYPLQDLVTRRGFVDETAAALDALHDLVQSGGPALLVGAPLAGPDLPYNAAILMVPGQARQVARKCELPNTDVFDERRIFARDPHPSPLVYRDWTLGVMVCEDMWHAPVAQALASKGADVLIVINGSPMEINKQNVRHQHASRRVKDAGVPLLYLNLVGGQDEMVFDGASFVMDSAGRVVAQAGMAIESVLDITLTRAPSLVAVHTTPAIISYPENLAAIHATLVLGLRDYVNKNDFSEVVLGLSGGLDSALVASLAVDALGPERVIALMLPTQHTGSDSRSLAFDMAKRLGVRYGSVPIINIASEHESALNVALSHVGGAGSASGRAVASENIQARVRGALLMALTNARPGALVLSTGNKSEMSVGYATLYGDMCGGFNPIKDLYKTQVQDLCRWRNNAVPVDVLGGPSPIPDEIITRPPSAELAPDQTDEKALGAYPVLDAVLKALVEHQLSPTLAAESASVQLGQAVGVEYAQRIAGLLKRAEYKRRQAPPGIKISPRSFGLGWRYPITNKASL